MHFQGLSQSAYLERWPSKTRKKFYKLPNPIQDAWLHAILYSELYREFYRNILDTLLSRQNATNKWQINLDKGEKKDWGFIPANSSHTTVCTVWTQTWNLLVVAARGAHHLLGQGRGLAVLLRVLVLHGDRGCMDWGRAGHCRSSFFWWPSLHQFLSCLKDSI